MSITRKPLSEEASALLSAEPPRRLKQGKYLEPHEIDERNALIRIEHEAGIGYRTIGNRYGISASRVRDILYPELRNRSQYKAQSVKGNSRTADRRRVRAAMLPIHNGSSADDFLRLLAEAKISQKRFAKHLGYSEHAVNHYANGKAQMPLHVRRYLELLIYVRKNVKLVRSIRLEDEGIEMP